MTSKPLTSTRTPNIGDVDDGGEPPDKARVLKRLVGLVALTAMFASVFLAATTGPSAADWREECVGEGCSGEEKKELYRSFRNECVYEKCWAEEVGELAGTGVNSSGRYNSPSLVLEMMNDFQSRSGYDAWQVEVRPGKTNTFFDRVWREILAFFDGRVVGFSCDFDAGTGYVGNCGL